MDTDRNALEDQVVGCVMGNVRWKVDGGWKVEYGRWKEKDGS